MDAVLRRAEQQAGVVILFQTNVRHSRPDLQSRFLVLHKLPRLPGRPGFYLSMTLLLKFLYYFPVKD